MSMTSVKMLAATVLLTCGMGLSIGTGWLATADAQTAIPTKAAPTKKDAEAELKQVQDDYKQGEKKLVEVYNQVREAQIRTLAAVRSKQAEIGLEKLAFKTAKWEYGFAEMNDTFDAVQFSTFLQARESEHWEFLGSTTLGSNGGVFQWLFRRPANTQTNLSRVQLQDRLLQDRQLLDMHQRNLSMNGHLQLGENLTTASSSLGFGVESL